MVPVVDERKLTQELLTLNSQLARGLLIDEEAVDRLGYILHSNGLKKLGTAAGIVARLAS